MANEIGGRADKTGNRFEYNCVINYFIDILKEKIVSCEWEPIGDDELITDIKVVCHDKTIKYIQCKQRNANSDNWTIATITNKLLTKWKIHLDSNARNIVVIQTPLSATSIADLSQRAKNTNSSPKDFYNSQILKSAKVKKDYDKFCNGIGIKLILNSGELDEREILRSIDYLSRIEVNSTPDLNFYEELLEKIEYLFIGDPKIIYDIFINLLINGNIWSKKIDLKYLYDFLSTNGITLKNLKNDNLTKPRLNSLNEEFHMLTQLINNDLIVRDETEVCLNEVKSGNSIILHGSAGMGKSSCISGLIGKLDENNIPYIAIKLDIKVPKVSEEIWSKEVLGLNYSLTECLDKIYTNQRVVLILDQLDSLRWTQTHSRDSILVCDEIIQSVNKKNMDRGNYPISVIFTCRTFDLENDNVIKKLFETDSNKIKWKKIKVDRLSKSVVTEIVGPDYLKLNSRLQELLVIPNNLYIWTKLKDKNNSDIAYTGNLISQWFDEIVERAGNDINKNDLDRLKNELVSKLIEQQRININSKQLNTNRKILNYLISEKFLLEDNYGFISFYHQSILDYFTIKNMLDRYNSGVKIVDLIGDKDNQLPSKRFQLQLFLEEVQSCEGNKKLIEIINEILISNDIRVYIKYVCYEVLGQLNVVNNDIVSYLVDNINDYIVNTVFINHQPYIINLIEQGIFEEWIKDAQKREIVFSALRSINNIFTEIEINFIKNHINIDEILDKKLYKTFGYDVMHENAEIFNLRFELIKKYPDLFDIHIDFNKSVQINENRVMYIIKYLCNQGLDTERINHNIYHLDKIEEYINIPLQKDEEIINELLQYIPKITGDNFDYYGWKNKSILESNLKRLIINILKKANYNLVSKDPNKFFEVYKDYFDKGYIIHNELILEAFMHFPCEYTYKILSYLSKNLDNNIFEKTSGETTEISLFEKIILKFIENLSVEEYSNIEKLILDYIPSNIVERYKSIQELRKEYGFGDCYFSHYGDLQLELLKIIPENKLTIRAKRELEVLKRKFYKGKTTKFDNNKSYSGSVVSAISNKELSDKQWIKIITDKSEKPHKLHRYVNGTFISTDINALASSFSNEIRKNPERAINLVLNNISQIRKEFLTSFFSTLGYYENIDNIPIQKLEEVILKISKEQIENYLVSICKIINKHSDTNWSIKIVELVKETYIKIKSNIIENDRLIADDKERKDDLIMRTLNSSIGNFSEAAGTLLNSRVELFEEFENIILEMNNSEDKLINFATLNLLRPCLNIDKDYAIENIIKWSFKSELNLSHYDIRNILYWSFSNNDTYKEKIKEIVISNISSSNELVKKNMSFLLIDLYILHNEDFELINNISDDKKIQEYMIEMLILYFENHEQKNKSKSLILKILNKSNIGYNSLSRLFDDEFINMTEDYEFLLEILKITDSLTIGHSFINYIKKSTENIIVFKDLIFKICDNVIGSKKEIKDMDEYYIEKLVNIVINLFDQVVNNEKYKEVKIKCLDIWDKMFEKGIGNIRNISKEISSK